MNPNSKEAGTNIWESVSLGFFSSTFGGSTSGYIIVRGYHLQTLPSFAYGILSEVQGYHLWMHTNIVEQYYHL